MRGGEDEFFSFGVQPKTPADVKKIKDLGEKLHEIRNKLKDENLPKEVDDFFKYLTKSGDVPLSMFTDEVKKWMIENDIQRNYKIISVSF